MPDPTLKEDIARLLTLAGEEDVEVGGESDPRGKAPSSGSGSPVDVGEDETVMEPMAAAGGPDRDYGERPPSCFGLPLPQSVISRVGLGVLVLVLASVLTATFITPAARASGHRHHQPPPSPIAQPLAATASAPKMHGSHAAKSSRTHEPTSPTKPRKLSDQQPHQQPPFETLSREKEIVASDAAFTAQLGASRARLQLKWEQTDEKAEARRKAADGKAAAEETAAEEPSAASKPPARNERPGGGRAMAATPGAHQKQHASHRKE